MIRAVVLALVAVLVAAVAGCGQTGSLYLPDESVETPVEIRVPDEEEKKKEDKPAVPPGG